MNKKYIIGEFPEIVQEVYERIWVLNKEHALYTKKLFNDMKKTGFSAIEWAEAFDDHYYYSYYKDIITEDERRAVLEILFPFIFGSNNER